MAPRAEPKARRRLLVVACAGAVVGMVGLAYASVPLYRRFCQVTGFNGVARRGEGGPTGPALDRTLLVRFDTNVRGGLPWRFTPDKPSQVTRIGASTLAYFTVTNTSDHAITGRAAYNVAPEAAGPYFIKTQCFCFSDQTVPAHKTVDFPVVYYVEPAFAKDPDTRAFQEITLSYSFFPSPDAHPSAARG
jgi:cytochrome c oxidase assembly protein subunit 11